MKKMKITAVTCAVAVLAAGLLWYGIPAGFLIATLQKRIEAESGYRLSIAGDTRIGLWPAPTLFIGDLTVLDTDDSGSQGRFRADSVRVGLSFASLIGGPLHITEIVVSRPTVSVPVARERATQPSSVGPAGMAQALRVDRVKIEDGTLALLSRSDRVEGRIERINLEASPTSSDGRIEVKGAAYWGNQALRIELKADARSPRLEGQTIPIEFTLEAPGMLAGPLSATAEVGIRNTLVRVNGLTGKIGASNFNGWGSVDFAATKPLVRGDVDFDRLDLYVPIADISLDGLRLFDAQVQLSAAEFNIDKFAFAPISVDVTINAGMLQAVLARTGMYGGQADGTVVVDASGSVPTQAMQIDISGVNALPLLSDVADFRWLDGRMNAKIDVRASGAEQKTFLSTLSGRVDALLADGAIRGVDFSKLIRNLTTATLSGWQEGREEKTDLAEFSAQFVIQNGRVRTDNLLLVGPFVRVTGTGTVDLAAKTVQFKVEPKLVAKQDAGASADATGFGVPVIVEGNWSEPRIYPDVPGMLENPGAAYDQLRKLGSGLFGGSTQPSGRNALDTIFEGIGNLLNRPPGDRRNNQKK